MNENNINDDITNEKTKKNSVLVGVIIGLLIGLLLGVVACTVYNKFLSDKENDNKDTIEKEDNGSDKKNEMEVIADNDTEHEIITFDDISNLMSKDPTKDKAYKIKDVVYNNKKASIYIDYTFQYEKYDALPDDKTTGNTKLVIKHGNTILNIVETQKYSKVVMTYLNVVDGKYLIYGDKRCSALINGNCLIGKLDDYNNIYLVSADNKESIEKYHNDSKYFIYDISSDDNGITYKTLDNSYGNGMWSCDSTTGDLQKVYNMKYSSGKFSYPELVSKVTYAEYCKNKDDSIF